MFKKIITLLFVLTWCFTLSAQDFMEVSPTLKPVNHDPALEATWDVQFNYDATVITGAAGNAGAVYIPTINKFWTSRWATGVAHQWNANGTLDLEFTLPFTGTRGMCFDGQFVYHSTNTTTVQKVDPVTRTVVGTVPVAGAPNGFRFITYNPDGNSGAGSIIGGNWTSPNLNFYEFSKTGTLLRTINSTVTGVYGLAYDNWSPGGPFLWVWSQGAGAGTPQLIQQMNYTTGLYTGVTHDVITDVGVGNASAIAGGLFITDELVPGFVTLGGMLQGTPDRLFGYELTTTGPPCPVGAPTNPNPPDGATNVPIAGNTATWTNGAGTTQVELWFGPTGNLTQVYSGSPITSFALPTLNYFTTYGWYVKDKNDTCFTQGPTWTFTTVQDPNLIEWCDEFASIGNWTILGPLGLTNWSSNPSGSAGGTAPELRMSWTPSFTGESKIRSSVLPVAFLNNWLTYYSFNFYFDWYANPSGTITVAVTYDGGATSTPLYSVVDPTGNVGPGVISGQFTTPASGTTNMQLEISFNGNSFNNDNIYWDNMCIYQIVPVELTSFTATADYGVVELNWITATETNNQGFEVQRSAGGEFETIAFVEGHGTTTEIQAYSYTDRSVSVGSYSYRLKQIDFDGTTTYSNIVEVDVPMLKEFALDQNYPNPFNPSTKIAFRLAVDSKVSLKVFDVLGQEVAALVNTNLVAGAHNINFDASSLNSGVYLYRLEATGIDGTNFVDVKKMILTK